MKSLINLILGFYLLSLSGLSLAQEPTVISDDNYVITIFSDGSGALGRRFDPTSTVSCTSFSCEYKRKKANENTVYEDTWDFRIKNDEMTDEQIITTSRYPHKISKEFGEMKLKSNIYLWLNLSDPSQEILCVGGNDYPGIAAMIRVDENKAITTNEKGCLVLSPALDTQLRSGVNLVIRGSHWPYKRPETQNIGLDGYSKITEFLRSRRK